MHFSTDALPERDRMTIWREVLGRRIVKAEFETLAGSRFFHEATFRNLPGLSLGFCAAGGFRGTRTRSLVKDGNDDLMLTVNTEGVAHTMQFGREASAEPFDAALMSCAEWGQFSVPAPARFTIIAVPRKPIAAMVKDPEAAAGQLLRKEMEPLRLLTSYVSSADNGLTFANPELRHLFITHVYDLVALALGASADAAALAQNRGLRAARLNAIKADIIARLADEQLSVADIARAHRVTARYVQMLFEAAGTTFSQYLLEQRLQHARRRLADVHFLDRTISAIAYDSGFANLSYFNRSFRRRFGATPSDVRAEAQRAVERD